MRSIKSLKDVVDWGLCIGCGACYSICSKDAIELVNLEHIGIRPMIDTDQCNNCPEYRNCLECCPGYRVDALIQQNNLNSIGKCDNLLIGPTYAIWEGAAFDPEIRYNASSGGILTAIALFCLEQEHMKLVLHTGPNAEKPWYNQTVVSRDRKDLLSRTGSRYAVSSPCDSLKLIEDSDGPCVFIGKPCDASAVMALRKRRPALDKKIGAVLSFCCAGVPSTQGTLDLMAQLKVDKENIAHISYRGRGWPGGFSIRNRSDELKQYLPYMESWHFLQRYRSFRCKLCPDGLGQICDISCGDAWHRYDENMDNPGLSLVMARSMRGKEIINRAIEAGYLLLEPSNVKNVVRAQGLVERRKAVFGRLMAMKLLMIPITRFKGFRLFRAWLKASTVVKAKSFMGTLRRLLTRGLWHRRQIFPD